MDKISFIIPVKVTISFPQGRIFTRAVIQNESENAILYLKNILFDDIMDTDNDEDVKYKVKVGKAKKVK